MLAVLFLLDLVLATQVCCLSSDLLILLKLFFLQGGIHIYHLLTTYIASWPTLLFSLLTVSCRRIAYLLSTNLY